jgi:hypothetical protein
MQRRQSIERVGAQVDAGQADEPDPLEVGRERRITELILREVQYL